MFLAYAESRYFVDEALVEAGCQGDVAQIKRLIAWGADPNGHDDNDGYALPCAVVKGHVEAARALLERGADPNLGGSYGIARNLAIGRVPIPRCAGSSSGTRGDLDLYGRNR